MPDWSQDWRGYWGAVYEDAHGLRRAVEARGHRLSTFRPLDNAASVLFAWCGMCGLYTSMAIMTRKTHWGVVDPILQSSLTSHGYTGVPPCQEVKDYALLLVMAS